MTRVEIEGRRVDCQESILSMASRDDRRRVHKRNHQHDLSLNDAPEIFFLRALPARYQRPSGASP
jgi:hypothetical protein